MVPYISKDLTGLEVIQEISFNAKTFQFEAKIIRMALMAKGYTVKGEPICIPPLFWVKFE